MENRRKEQLEGTWVLVERGDEGRSEFDFSNIWASKLICPATRRNFMLLQYLGNFVHEIQSCASVADGYGLVTLPMAMVHSNSSIWYVRRVAFCFRFSTRV